MSTSLINVPTRSALVLVNNNNNNNNFICIAVYTKALYRFTIKKKKITN